MYLWRKTNLRQFLQNDFHGPRFIDPKSNDLMAGPVAFQTADGMSDLLTMDTFFDRVAPAVIMANDKKSGGFIDIDRNGNAAQYFRDIVLVGQNAVHAGFSDHVYKIHAIILFDPVQDRQLHPSIHTVKASRPNTHVTSPILVDFGQHSTKK